MKQSPYILWFEDIRLSDVALVGGKNASLGEMICELSAVGIHVPRGFALTTAAYDYFLDETGIRARMNELLEETKNVDVVSGSAVSGQIRDLILQAPFPEVLQTALIECYKQLSADYHLTAADVAVRSSATVEDLVDASFAGQQETYLNIHGEQQLIEAVHRCIASLFTHRAISYRSTKQLGDQEVKMSVGIQKMVRSDTGAAGVAFSIDPESGFRDAVVINGAWGLGELVVQGKVDADEFIVFKPTLLSGVQHDADHFQFQYQPIIGRRLGAKQTRLVYTPENDVEAIGSVQEIPTDQDVAHQFCLTDSEVLQLAYVVTLIEQHYGKPMDVEWARDGQTGQLFITQARPETVQSQVSSTILETITIEQSGDVVLEGVAVGSRVGVGEVNVIQSSSDMDSFRPGQILVTEITDPDWEPLIKQAAAVVTNAGGRTSHAAIVARELGIPAIVGTKHATSALKTGQTVTVSCSEGERGKVYAGAVPYRIDQVDVGQLPPTKTKIMMIVGDPQRVFDYSRIPQQGVGLVRQELIILNHIKIHPLALLYPDRVSDPAVRAQIKELTSAFPSPPEYFTAKLAEGIGKIAAAFYPHDVIVRLSDFKSNEYRSLLGGHDFEPHEENPMLGWRGASRYYSDDYKAAFALECEALRRVRIDMGLSHVKLMVPFCRTPAEGRQVIALMAEHGLVQGQDGLEVYVMCELPSNVILADQFAEIFDGFSIGSNDLTQLTLGLDRDSGLVAHLYDESNEAIKISIAHAITAAHAAGIPIGICGQAPSDFPAFAQWLVEQGIDSIALNPDAVISTTIKIAEFEN